MTIELVQKHFTEVYEREVHNLFRFCLLRVSDREKALDLTQEAFTRLWQSYRKSDVIESPKALLFTIARNLIIDWYRKKKSLSLENLSADEEIEFDVKDEGATEAIEQGAEVKQVLLLLNKLSPEFREAVYLRYIEGLPPQEIAQVLGLNANVVSIRITRGLARLRELLGVNNDEKSYE